MQATLFHAKNTRDSMFYQKDGSIYSKTDALIACADGGYTMVGKWDVKDTLLDNEDALYMTLEGIYEQSQNIDKSWSGEVRNRSTSVGDIVKIGNNIFIVAGCGFEKIA